MVAAALLDDPIWVALTTEQASLAEVVGEARRFPAAMTALAAIADPRGGPALAGPARPGLVAISDGAVAGWADLWTMLAGGGFAGLFLDADVQVPPLLAVIDRIEIAQMVQTMPAASGPGVDRLGSADVELGAADADEMVALARLTQPGPFGPRTHELGTFLGVRDEGALVAMAGQRLRIPGFIEISAVCTHPDHARRGHAARLMAELARRIQAVGATAFLHVRASNSRAIGLYERLGFRIRRTFDYTMVRHAGARPTSADET